MPRDWPQVGLYLVAVVALAWPLARYLAAVLEDRTPRGPVRRALRAVEGAIYALARVNEDRAMDWREYARAFVVFTFGGMLAVYALQRLQTVLPLNPAGLGPVRPEPALNTAVSFATNTNWQSYAGEATLGYLVQSLGLVVQQFVSAAAGLAVMAAVIRGIARRTTDDLGSFWVDLTRGTVYVLLPLALALAVALASQGVVQTWAGPAIARTLDGAQQVIARGPVASQVAIKQLGTNGGGFFGANSAHPFENPTPLAGLLETITLGNRQAVALLPVGGLDPMALARAAQLSSLADETPEGRSVVELVKREFGLRGRGVGRECAPENGHDAMRFLPFSAQTRMSGVDFNGTRIRKGAPDAVFTYLRDAGAEVPAELRQITETIARGGGTPLVVAQDGRALGVIHLKDVVKGGIRERFARLREMGIRTVMITGDNPLTAAAIAAEAGVDDFLAEATPEAKLALIREHQEQGRLVAMAGDGTNDAPALA